MTTTTILSDNGVSSGSAGIKTTGGNDGTLALQTTTAGGAATTAVTIDTSQNVGIGTSSPSGKLNVISGSVAQLIIGFGGTSASYLDSDLIVFRNAATTERMRISSAGLVLINATSTSYNEQLKISFPNTQGIHLNESTSSSSVNYQYFTKGATPTNVGAIYYNGSVMAYQTTSDYRLKENIAPMTGALAKINALKPVTYTWKDNQRDGEGFIAHELQEHFPDAVSGIKDDVDENSNPKYQGMDASILIATLTAAIQEQQALITALTARIETLENKT